MIRTLFARRIRGNFALWLIFAIGLSLANFAAAAEKTGKFVDEVFKDAAGSHKYSVFVPRDYAPDKKWPVILFLHGAGERGVDGHKQIEVGLGPYVRQQAETFPALVVFPQCEDLKGAILSGWTAGSPDGKRAIEILKAVEKQYSIDSQRRILTGWSMGGYGVWSLATAAPDYWSAIAPMSGGGDVSQASKLTKLPIWAFHGADDTVVRPDATRAMIAAVNAAGGHARYSEVSGVAHDVWKYSYASDALYRWMLDPAHANAEQVELRAKPGQAAPLEPKQNDPFVPAVDILNAVCIRMGNDMLKTLADAVPRTIPADVLTGRIADIYDSTVTQGYSFNVQFTQITYAGTVERAVIRAYRKDRLNLQLGLRNVTLNIGRTYISGESHSATAGPINIVMGNRRPLWLSLALEPYIENRKLRVRHVGTWFEIPNDNWYVTGPAGVSTSGFGMTRADVSNGLVSGIYGKKSRIEREITAVVPKLIARIEQTFDRPELGEMVHSFWPLPVYQPRLRVWPQAVSTDEEGISLSMGLTAAAIDPQHAPKQPQIVEASSVSLSEQPRGAGLNVALAPNILQPLTQLLIDADVARIHLTDIPEKQFSLLGNRQALSDAIPELARMSPSTELWGELILTSPISILDSPTATSPTPSEQDHKPAVATKPVALIEGAAADETAKPDVATSPAPKVDSPTRALRIAAPKVVIALSIRTEPKADWKPFAQFTFSVGQEATAGVERPNYQDRELRLDWSGKPAIECTAKFAPGYHAENQKIDTDKIRQLFVDAWQGWTREGSLAKSHMNDVDLGYTRLRLGSATWTGEELLLAYAAPGIKVTNSSDVELVYDMKGPYSGWGGPYTLPPGRSHEYSVASPLTYRRKVDGTFSTFTLPAGSHVEFRRESEGKEPSLILLQPRSKTAKPTAANAPAKP
nr:hypothetical protein [uncultured bacterium]